MLEFSGKIKGLVIIFVGIILVLLLGLFSQKLTVPPMYISLGLRGSHGPAVCGKFERNLHGQTRCTGCPSWYKMELSWAEKGRPW